MAESLDIRPIAKSYATIANLTERSIREMVFDGRLAPGARVNEVELAEAFGISRGPLREAIQRLASQGLLTTRTHHGATVKVFEWDELRELYEVRIALEAFAVVAGAARADLDQLESLSKLLRETQRLLSLSGTESYPSDLDFHRQIVALSGNSALMEMHALTLQKIELARSRSAKDPRRAREAMQEHHNVLNALLEGTPDLAAQALQDHLMRSLHSAGAILSGAPEAGRDPGAEGNVPVNTSQHSRFWESIRVDSGPERASIANRSGDVSTNPDFPL